MSYSPVRTSDSMCRSTRLETSGGPGKKWCRQSRFCPQTCLSARALVKRASSRYMTRRGMTLSKMSKTVSSCGPMSSQWKPLFLRGAYGAVSGSVDGERSARQQPSWPGYALRYTSSALVRLSSRASIYVWLRCRPSGKMTCAPADPTITSALTNPCAQYRQMVEGFPRISA